MDIKSLGNNGYNYLSRYSNNYIMEIDTSANKVDESLSSDEFLKELKEIFPDVKIRTANVTNENRNKFAGGTGHYNIVINDKYFEEIAGDPQKRLDFKQRVQDIINATNMCKNWAKSDNIDYYESGSIIDDTGLSNAWSSMRTLDPEKNTLSNAMSSVSISRFAPIFLLNSVDSLDDLSSEHNELLQMLIEKIKSKNFLEKKNEQNRINEVISEKFAESLKLRAERFLEFRKEKSLEKNAWEDIMNEVYELKEESLTERFQVGV